MKKNKEYMVFAAEETSVEGRRVKGIIPYNVLGQDQGGGLKRRLNFGVFSKALSNNRIFACFAHDRSKPMAQKPNGTLTLTDTPTGLQIEFEVPEGLSYGEDCLTLIKNKLMIGFSFGGYIDASRRTETPVRIEDITEFDLEEVSPVFNPVFLTKAEISVYEQEEAVEAAPEAPVEASETSVEAPEAVPEAPEAPVEEEGYTLEEAQRIIRQMKLKAK